MLHEAIFLATCLATNVARQVARKLSRVTPQFCNLQRHLRVARKVEISLTFRNVARQVAACDMSIATCNTILCKIRQLEPVFCSQEFSSWRRKSCKQFPAGANVWDPLCNLQCFSVVIVVRQVARKIASCNMALTNTAISLATLPAIYYVIDSE